MEQFKLKVERCSHWGRFFFVCYRAQPFFIEQALAIVQQCNDHTDKRCIVERSGHSVGVAISIHFNLKF